MPIKVTCTNCGGVLHAPDDAGGKRGRCPTCGNILPIPAAGGGSGGGAGLPDAPSGAPGQRPPSFADFASGPQVGPPADPPRAAAKASIPYASTTSDPPPARAARPADPPPRRAADPFARKASFATGGAAEPTSEGMVKGWKRCRGGLGWVQAAMFFLFIPVVLLPGYFVANEVMKALSTANPKPDLIPFKDPGYVGVAGLNSDAELWVAAGVIPVVLALICMLFGRLGTAGGPKRAAVGGPAMLSALATLIALCSLVALVFPNVSNAIFGGDPLPAGKILMDVSTPGDYLGMIQRFALFAGLGASVVGEFWFSSAVGRIGSALADGRAAARSTRYQMLLGLVVIGLVGTAAVAPSDNFGLWSPKYNTPTVPGEFTNYNTKRQVAENPVHQAGKETNDIVAGEWEKHVGPRFGMAGQYQAVIMPAAFLLCGLVVWLMYVRMVGAARGAIRGWLDAHAGP